MGEIEDSPVNLNDGDKETVILKKDPTALGNDFKNEADFEYTTTSGSSTLTLQKDPSLKDMSYFIQGDIRVSGNSHLIMNLNSTKGQGLFRLDGAIRAYGSIIEINDVNTFDIQAGGSITVENGGTLNINNVDILTNQS
ncbi:hypothetical protein, partial [Campylobacter avium]|uniref:hypothetical protein n=1 Tax=Campylobacter avium TaxID=522485 RepID=UPI002354F246